ncbi:hypothetical protein EV210_101171 [Anaerospora hongkongensis]|uniref:Uncharacterized protein n=1 Tax=Anaerospora hongkongensis TaxID=244830 RepID=A0A4R1QBZ7_9FIRM|nr:hypothetical protein EV210_101171 [Anaerospora hongkongensis]
MIRCSKVQDGLYLVKEDDKLIGIIFLANEAHRERGDRYVLDVPVYNLGAMVQLNTKKIPGSLEQVAVNDLMAWLEAKINPDQ